MASSHNDNTRDVSLRTDLNYNPLILSGPARYKQVVTMLFNMIPGMDEFNPNKGLNIAAKLFVPAMNGVRDTEYETEILNQFSQYTDLSLTNIVAMSLDGAYCVGFSIMTRDGVYQALVSHKADDLSVLIVNQNNAVSAY